MSYLPSFPFREAARRLSLMAASALVLILTAWLGASPASAQQPRHGDAVHGEGAMGSEPFDEEIPELPEEQSSSTSHRVTIGGESVAYTATAGNYLLREEDGTPKASFFFISYVRDVPEEERARRPVIFAFNGGPGSSSVWLHLGLYGPRRVKMKAEGWAPAPPYELVANEHSILDVADLVFIDPVTTGFSRAVPGVEDDEFHGVVEDIESVGELIRLWTGRNDRWASPKFLSGESYGTFRAAGLVNYLQERHGMYFNGVLLVSSILQMQTARFDVGNDLPCVLFLPTYTATAWFHGQLPADLQEAGLEAAVRQAREFARGPYASALMQGSGLPDEERRATAAGLARFTGLSEEYVERTDLCVRIFRFTKELLRDEGKTVGRLDSRFTGYDRDSAGESFDYDPSMSAIRGAYSTLLNDYVRRELEYDSDLPYEILTGRVHPWSYDDFAGRYANMAEPLREAMTRNPALHVFVANGYYDLATPFFATEYTFSHLGLPPELRGNISMAFYPAGHMMYIQESSLEAMRQDLLEAIDAAIP